MAKINKDFKSTSKCRRPEGCNNCSNRMCGESRWKNSAAIRITALKGKRTISSRRKVLPV